VFSVGKNCSISILVCLVLVCIVGIGLIQFEYVYKKLKNQSENYHKILLLTTARID